MNWPEDEGPDEHDLEDEFADGPELDQVPCPSCGRMIYDDTDKCPHCGDWVMPMASAAARRPTWIWWTALVLAAVMLITWGLWG